MGTHVRCQNPACSLPDGLFEPTRKNNMYCSPACRQAALRSRQKESQETLLDQRLRKLPVSVASTIKGMSEEHNIEAAMQALSAVNLLLNIAEAWPKEVRQLVGSDQQKTANLEVELTRYRQICDMSDRSVLEKRWMALGAAFNYHRLLDPHVAPGEENWHAYMQVTDMETLSAAFVHTEAFYQNWMFFVEATALKKAERRIAELEQTIERFTIADQKAKEAISELQWDTNRSSNRIDSLEQELVRANRIIECYESSQNEMNNAIEQRWLGLRQDFMELGERRSYQPMPLMHLRKIHPGIIENIGKGKDRWKWASESLDPEALMVVLTFAMFESNELELEEERAKFATLLKDFMQAGKKISSLERHVQRFARMKILKSRASMLQELMLLGGRLKYTLLTDLGIGEGIDQWLIYVRGVSDEDLAKAIAHGYWQADSLAMAAIEASDAKLDRQMRCRINELESDVVRRDKQIAALEQSRQEPDGLEYHREEDRIIIERQTQRIVELEGEVYDSITAIHRLEESHGSAIYQMNRLLAQAQTSLQEGQSKH